MCILGTLHKLGDISRAEALFAGTNFSYALVEDSSFERNATVCSPESLLGNSSELIESK